MKPAGFICKLDKLGRIVIPKPIRMMYDLHEEDSLELFTDTDGFMIKKYCKACDLCGNGDDLVEFKGKAICKDCLKELKNL